MSVIGILAIAACWVAICEIFVWLYQLDLPEPVRRNRRLFKLTNSSKLLQMRKGYKEGDCDSKKVPNR